MVFGPAYRSFCQITLIASQRVRFSTSVFLQSYENAKVNRVMNKLMQKSGGKKKKFYAFLPGGTSPYFDHISNHRTSFKCDRRQTALNKVFMKSITDLMSTGELCPEITDRGIQISKVKVTPTFHQINVYWLANGNEADNETEKLLSEVAPKLRHELSQLQIMGSVPKIEFVKDSSYLNYMVVENILKTADFGEDFVPTPLANDWKSDGLDPNVTHNVKDENAEDVNEQPSSSEVVELPLPVMRMDTFGLNHEAIMKKIMLSVQKAKAAHRRDSSVELFVNGVAEASETGTTLDTKGRKKLLKEFILKKKLEWKKTVNKEKKYRPELVIHEQEMESSLVDEFLQCNDEEDCIEGFDRDASYVEDDYSKN